MCRRVTCNQCQKPTFAGCGAHIEQVLGDVAPGDRCKCNEKSASKDAAKGGEAAARPWWKL